MIETLEEFNEVLNRLKTHENENNLGPHMQSKLDSFLEVEKLINDLSLADVMPCFPTNEKIKEAADEWEKKASCGNFWGAYVNDDFIAGVDWLKSELKPKSNKA